MLTTKDNPYNPWTEWDLWLRWDEEHGYYTNALVARVSNPSLDITDEDELQELYEMATATILENDITEMYIIAPKPDGFDEYDMVEV